VSETFERSGIELATFPLVINRHVGLIWADSKVDEASIFYFMLPD